MRTYFKRARAIGDICSVTEKKMKKEEKKAVYVYLSHWPSRGRIDHNIHDNYRTVNDEIILVIELARLFVQFNECFAPN